MAGQPEHQDLHRRSVPRQCRPAESRQERRRADFTTSNYRDLTEAFLNIITSVALAQDPMSYTTYAAPKQSITEGKYGYIAHFIPRERAMWEGHLRRYRLGDDGSFPTNIDNPPIRSSCPELRSFPSNGTPAPSSTNRTTARVVYTSKPSAGLWPLLDFMGSSIDATDLSVLTSAQVTQVKNFIQNFNQADGINANSAYEGLYRLGETFHFNPQLVGYPLVWKSYFDASYKSFYDHYSSGSTARAEVVYTGANDGKLHCFQSQTDGDNAAGTELWSYIPFALLKQLKEPALNPLITDQPHLFCRRQVVGQGHQGPQKRRHLLQRLPRLEDRAFLRTGHRRPRLLRPGYNQPEGVKRFCGRHRTAPKP